MRGERHVRLWTRSSCVGVPRLHRYLSLLLGERAEGKGDMPSAVGSTPLHAWRGDQCDNGIPESSTPGVEPTATLVLLHRQHLEGAERDEASASTHQHSAAECATTEPSGGVFRTPGTLAVGIDSDGGGGRLE